MSRPEGLNRIAIVGSRGFPSTYSGYETMIRYLARDWVRRGLDVTVYCREREEGMRGWQTEGVRCRWTPGFESVSLSTLSYGLTSHLDVCLRGYDAVLVVNVANGYFLPVLNLRDIGCVVNTDGIEWERGKWGKTARRVFRIAADAVASFADVTVADSREIARIWHETFGIESEFIPYGAPVLPKLGTDRIETLGLTPAGYRLVVARMVPENNVELALDALADDDLRLVVVGTGTGDTPVERRLAKLNRTGAILWLGHVSDQEQLNQLWNHCALYIHGHSVGGTNPSLLQALGAGAPTIALDTPFNREVVGNPDQLYSMDTDALHKLATRAATDGSLRDEWRKLGQRNIAENYSWDDVSERYLQALSRAKARRQR